MPLEFGARFKHPAPIANVPFSPHRPSNAEETPLGLPAWTPDGDEGQQPAPTANKPADKPAKGETPLGLPTWKF